MRLTWTVGTLDLATPFRISRGVMSTRDAVTVTATDPATGLCGCGEVVTSVYARLDVARIDTELRAVRARDDDSISLDDALALVHPAIAAAVWSAIADLTSCSAGVAVATHLGLPLPAQVPIARTVGIGTPEEMAAEAADLVGHGFGLLKVKADGDAAASVRRLTAVTAAAPGTEMIVDPNEAWTAETALSVLADIRGLPVVALEQPLPAQDRDGIRELRSRSGIPILADEAVHTLADLDGLCGLADAVNIKLPKCGGIYRAHELATAARDRGMDVMLGCLVSSSLSIAPAVHLASLARWCDLDGHLLLARDPWTGLGGEDGMLRPSGRPGLGVHRRENEMT
ncbi:dipeptide epimerase (plasmid) [Rhodococcus sp. ZPP]|jgi:L-alanine-DL-glutamate epimerase-like enolase superfamily enzyme|uniref:dipeptide epimerase n=1 Tax=unclassified Rhodococcus (in: high G+C Gram-positive bacteria) TaxID=192944 RepID=UPI001AD8522B|nr:MULTISPECIES: dipeptide epimerase [unclassified Rhodococcus (in: high G+C Gram-positive bacteria)]QTJ70492.1 dipeptide epimerase [Rhodococcus sp. ZPP]